MQQMVRAQVMNGNRNIPCLLHAAAQAHPEAPALVTAERTLSYRTLDRIVGQVAGRLRTYGCSSGTRAALYLPRDAQTVILLLALIRAGVVACPLSTRLPPKGLDPFLEAVDARLLVAEEEPKGVIQKGEVPVVDRSIFFEGKATEAVAGSRLPIDRLATAVFTSGSTGTPKAALHSLGNHYFSAKGSNENIALAPGDRWLLSLPLYHVGGLAILFRCLLAGAAVVVPLSGKPLREVLVRQRVTHVSLVATQMRRLLQDEGEVPSGLKAVLLGGSAIPPALIDEAHARGWPLYTSYGLTEMASQVATTPPNATRAQLRTSGAVLPHRELTLAPDGEILVRGETLFQGYLERGALRRPLDEEGWFHTGDLGTFGPDGLLRVRGRKDHLFISGGENIQPEEVEEALCRLKEVREAVVVPVPDEEYGQRPVAFVRGEEGAVPGDLALRLEAALPRFKIPDAFYAWPEGYDAAMKIDRGYFREEALRRHRDLGA